MAPKNARAEAHEAWSWLVRLHAAILGRIERDLAAAGCIPLSWYDVLLALEDAPGRRLRLGEVAERIVLSRSALSRSVERLAAHGHVRRESCPEDARGAYAALTEKGRRALARASPVYRAGIERYFAEGLSTEEVRRLLRALERIAARLEEPPPGRRTCVL